MGDGTIMRRTFGSEAQAAAKPSERGDDAARLGSARAGVAAGKVGGVFTFRAELDLTEIDTRGRPGVVWTGRAVELSRSHLTFRSRRMCYEGRELLLAVHLVDDRPVPLYGMVSKSEYDGDGLYRTVINLLPLPESEAIKDWVGGLHARAAP